MQSAVGYLMHLRIEQGEKKGHGLERPWGATWELQVGCRKACRTHSKLDTSLSVHWVFLGWAPSRDGRENRARTSITVADRCSTTLGTTCPLQSFALSWSLFRSESRSFSATLLGREPLLDRRSCNCSNPCLHHPRVHSHRELPTIATGHQAKGEGWGVK